MSNFITQSIEHGLPVNNTPEASRRYMQWKEDDVGLLLSDLEQPGHYDKWKQNKSGYSKRVAEEVFKSAMYHEAIKFKVRWLESRFKRWYQILTAPDIIHDEQALANAKDRMMKEFPYYERCKSVFDTTILSPSISSAPAVDESDQTSSRGSPLMESKTENFHMTQEPNSPTLNTPKPEAAISPEKRVPIGSQSIVTTTTIANSNLSFSALKKRKIQPYTPRMSNTLISPNQAKTNQLILQPHMTDNMLEDKKIRLMELELEGKKMDHEERMQQMKLEQLRLEIELQKLKSFTTNSSN